MMMEVLKMMMMMMKVVFICASRSRRAQSLVITRSPHSLKLTKNGARVDDDDDRDVEEALGFLITIMMIKMLAIIMNSK